ncbi:MAG: hypothetical protein Q8O84_04465 [Nanoarchaeota archaeon]|nr:hypothetical protein [Nanoarchaeota archaeon]
MKKNTRNKTGFLIGIIEHFNLENLVAQAKFSVPVNGSIEKAYGKLYDRHKSEKANIAVIEGRNADSINGTFYATPGNPLCNSEIIRGNHSLYVPTSGYAVLNHTF